MKNKKNKINATNKIIALNHMYKNNIKPYTNKSLFRTALGFTCIVFGVVTFFIPFTTMPLLILGGFLIGYDTKAFFKRIRYELHLVKLRFLKYVAECLK